MFNTRSKWHNVSFGRFVNNEVHIGSTSFLQIAKIPIDFTGNRKTHKRFASHLTEGPAGRLSVIPQITQHTTSLISSNKNWTEKCVEQFNYTKSFHGADIQPEFATVFLSDNLNNCRQHKCKLHSCKFLIWLKPVSLRSFSIEDTDGQKVHEWSLLKKLEQLNSILNPPHFLGEVDEQQKEQMGFDKIWTIAYSKEKPTYFVWNTDHVQCNLNQRCQSFLENTKAKMFLKGICWWKFRPKWTDIYCSWHISYIDSQNQNINMNSSEWATSHPRLDCHKLLEVLRSSRRNLSLANFSFRPIATNISCKYV